MAFRIRRVDYFYTTVRDEPGEGYAVLSQLASQGVNLLAFTAIPFGPTRTQLALFPEDSGAFVHAATLLGLAFDGPHPALLVQGDDELGALANIHARLAQANVNVFSSSGVASDRGSFGYVLYIRPDDFQRATEALAV